MDDGEGKMERKDDEGMERWMMERGKWRGNMMREWREDEELDQR